MEGNRLKQLKSARQRKTMHTRWHVAKSQLSNEAHFLLAQLLHDRNHNATLLTTFARSFKQRRTEVKLSNRFASIGTN